MGFKIRHRVMPSSNAVTLVPVSGTREVPPIRAAIASAGTVPDPPDVDHPMWPDVERQFGDHFREVAGSGDFIMAGEIPAGLDEFEVAESARAEHLLRNALVHYVRVSLSLMYRTTPERSLAEMMLRSVNAAIAVILGVVGDAMCVRLQGHPHLQSGCYDQMNLWADFKFRLVASAQKPKQYFAGNAAFPGKIELCEAIAKAGMTTHRLLKRAEDVAEMLSLYPVVLPLTVRPKKLAGFPFQIVEFAPEKAGSPVKIRVITNRGLDDRTVSVGFIIERLESSLHGKGIV